MRVKQFNQNSTNHKLSAYSQCACSITMSSGLSVFTRNTGAKLPTGFVALLASCQGTTVNACIIHNQGSSIMIGWMWLLGCMSYGEWLLKYTLLIPVVILETRYACLRYDILFITCPIAIVIRSVYVLWSVVSLPLWDINIDPCSSRSASKSNLVQYWAMRCRSWRSIEISRDMPIPCQQRPLTQHLQWMSQGLIPWGWVVAEYSQTVRGEVLSIFLQSKSVSRLRVILTHYGWRKICTGIFAGIRR